MAGKHCEALLAPGQSEAEEKVQTAAWFLETAMEGHFPENGVAPKGLALADLRRKKHQLARMRVAYDCAIVLLAAMMFFESPLWCQNSRETTTFISGEERCPIEGGKVDAELSGAPVLPPLYGIILESVCLLVATVTLVWETKTHNALARANVSRFASQALEPESALRIVALIWLDIGVYAVVRQHSFRFAPYGRIALFFFWRRVYGVFLSVRKCAGEFMNISMMFLMTVVFFAWIFAMLLDDERDRADVHNKIGENFADIWACLRTFFTIAAGAGFPDRTDDAMRNLRWTPFLFFPFMLLTFFLFTQIMLAIVYEVYQNVLQDRLKEFYEARTKGVARAFLELSVHGHKGERVVPFNVFHEVLEVLKENPALAKTLKGGNSRIIFTALDDDKSGELDLKEFFDACDLLLYKFWQAPATSWFERRCGLRFSGLKRLQDNGTLDLIVNGMLILNVFFILVESVYDLKNVPLPPFFDFLETFFSVIYVVDVILRLMVMSFGEYWSHGENRFDFVVSWVLFFAGIGSLCPQVTGFNSDVVRYLNILRFVRLLKLLKEIDRFKRMSLCIKQLVEVSFDMVALLLLSSLFYAVIGAQLFGGKLYRANPVLQDKDFVNNGYDILSFNDMGRSLGAIFCFLVNNFCPEYAEAMDLVTGLPWIGFLFCGTFFFIGVNIAFNVFTAFTIDVFLTLKQLNEEADESEEEKNLQNMRKACEEEGNHLHVQIPPEVLRMRVQVGVLNDLGAIIEEARTSAAVAAKQLDAM